VREFGDQLRPHRNDDAEPIVSISMVMKMKASASRLPCVVIMRASGIRADVVESGTSLDEKLQRRNVRARPASSPQQITSE